MQRTFLLCSGGDISTLPRQGIYLLAAEALTMLSSWLLQPMFPISIRCLRSIYAVGKTPQIFKSVVPCKTVDAASTREVPALFRPVQDFVNGSGGVESGSGWPWNSAQMTGPKPGPSLSVEIVAWRVHVQGPRARPKQAVSSCP